ncbi:ATP-dependent nuclease [Oerskovia paurometabola]|uniref:ATP-dependent nuclease n=1 Tax=Oerskovia paurometabola TaxID=162170 RepID=UPI00342435B7
MVSPTTSKLTSAWDTRRHAGDGWPLFLSSVAIAGLRGWKGESVEFRYPVVAIAGVNGAGKSTVLKAAAAAYQAPQGSGSAKTFYADDFFPSTPWEIVRGVVLTYTVRQGDSTETVAVRKPTSRWRGGPERKTRPSFFLDVSRIQPANTQIGYGRTAQDVISQGTTEPLSDKQVLQLNRILGRNYESASFDRTEDKQVGVVALSGIQYSNFHQGAGEDSALDLISLVSKAPDKSLVIIDEVEASLHPQAQRGLVTELLRLAHDKRLQVVVSTHSPYILEQLPSVARVFVSLDREMNRQVLYGVTTDFALNLMDDERHEELDIYCEDDASAYVIERLVAIGASELLPRVRITAVGPASTVIALGRVAVAGKLPRRGVCILDADQSAGDSHFLLPGVSSPERDVFAGLDESHWAIVAERLGRPAGELLDAKDAALQVDNHHAWCGEIARRLGGTVRPSKVWESLVDVWVKDVLDGEVVSEWCQSIEDLIEET